MTTKIFRLPLIGSVVALFMFNVPLIASEMDDRIEASAKESYIFRTYLKDDDIKIDSRDGAVTLTGTVYDETHIALASETVANLPGVTGVDNKLVEQSEGPAEYTDAWLVKKVQATLLFHRNVSADKIEVSVQDGLVTLRGEAANAAQKDLATEYAKDVEGVRDVVNEMTVPADAMKPGATTMSQKMDAVGAKMGTMGDKIDDASVTALVKMTLLYHRSTSGLNTTVEAKDGVVTLGGTARNAAEKDLAGKFAGDVRGVERVVNNMIIEGTEAKAN